MDENDFLAERFEAHRDRLRSVAYRILGSPSEADDAVQEAWLRLHRSDAAGVENLGGWLTTVVGRICLDMLRSRAARREEPLDRHRPSAETAAGTGRAAGADPEQEALLADSVGLALLVVLDTLTPAERLAFVLHDMFAVPFDRIAPVLERTPEATRQLASRARRRVRGASARAATAQGTSPDAPPAPTTAPATREVVDAFLTAARGGDFEALLAVLDPDVVLRADAPVPLMRGADEIRGRESVLNAFLGRAHGTHTALINGSVGAVWTPAAHPRGALLFTLADNRILTIDAIADPDRLHRLDIVRLDA
jgi:RNA polymerase sigma factor (sigma-70 family)